MYEYDKNNVGASQIVRSYSELCKLKTFEERYEYLKLSGRVGEETFGTNRHLNQVLYRNSAEWQRFRRDIIVRDNGCDLGIQDRIICPDVGFKIPRTSSIYIHHLNPLTPEDIINKSRKIFDPENVICCSFKTHQAIHYGDKKLLEPELIERRPFDTCPWR